MNLRFRQIHLDFHTSPHIDGIGDGFDKKRWQERLRRAEVNSITCFSKCHHGWSYHPTGVGKMHPQLSFDLLRAQYDACKEIGINVPVYLSAGVDNLASYEHPEWREIGSDGKYLGWSTEPLKAGFHKMDFMSPYLDYLCAQIEEAVELFSECDGIFLDIIDQNPGCSRWALDYMREAHLDPLLEQDRRTAAQAGLLRYYEKTTAACRSRRADMPVFHNSGHITRGDHEVLAFQSHLELESLPTGGWGYDHFPEGASYAANLGKSYLGMTGKFHTTWGEFGGLKHPNALRYECSAMLAFGARCSVGDQLHPSGDLDESTYEVIGAAYQEVAAKEPWCEGAVPFAQVAVLSSEAEHPETKLINAPDTGATRLLLEGHFLFTLLDRTMTFTGYDVLILPDDIRVDADLRSKLENYLASGGKLFLSGESGLAEDGSGLAVDVGAQWSGPSEFQPDYILAREDLCPFFSKTPFVAYLGSQRIRVTDGESLGEIHDPYFNRSYAHFCSHQHTPPRPEPSGFAAGARKGNVLYMAHRVFTAYRAYGQVNFRQYVDRCLRNLLGDQIAIRASLPSTGRVTLTRQQSRGRWIVHLLHANTINRGGPLKLSGGNVETVGRSLEVIEELLPIRDIHLSLRLKETISRVTLEPQGTAIPHVMMGNRIEVLVPEFTCHQMVVFHEG